LNIHDGLRRAVSALLHQAPRIGCRVPSVCVGTVPRFKIMRLGLWIVRILRGLTRTLPRLVGSLGRSRIVPGVSHVGGAFWIRSAYWRRFDLGRGHFISPLPARWRPPACQLLPFSGIKPQRTVNVPGKDGLPHRARWIHAVADLGCRALEVRFGTVLMVRFGVPAHSVVSRWGPCRLR
jgi:hypothetical protein